MPNVRGVYGVHPTLGTPGHWVETHDGVIVGLATTGLPAAAVSVIARQTAYTNAAQAQMPAGVTIAFTVYSLTPGDYDWEITSVEGVVF